MGRGGGSLPLQVAAAFADPWPQQVVARFLSALQRRMAAEAGSAEYVLACASATVVACPSRVPHESLTSLWDAALRQGGDVGVLAIQAALTLLDPPQAPITQPLSTAMPEVGAGAVGTALCAVYCTVLCSCCGCLPYAAVHCHA